MTVGAGAGLAFLNPPAFVGGLRASAAGFAIYLSRWPGTIWLWIVFDSSSYSSSYLINLLFDNLF